MATEELLDFEQLSTPIPGDHPCGESLRWDPLWDEIREAREARSDVVDESADSEPDWTRVLELTTEALYHRTKDLMVAGWMAEALVHRQGLAGLRDGLRAVADLVENFWDHLYPQVNEEGDLEVRAAPLVWLTDRDGGARMPVLLRSVVPLALASDEGELLSWAYSNARFVPPKGDTEDDQAYERRRADAEAKKDRFESSVQATPRDFYVTLYEDLEQCKAQLSRLAVAVDDRLGDAAPGWTALRQSLEDIELVVRRILNEKGGLPGSEPAQAAAHAEAGAAHAAAGDGRGGTGAGPIRTRGEAIARLKECAAFLKQNEPHSLIASLINRAVQWSEMPLERVLADLIKDQVTLAQIEETLGFRRSSESRPEEPP